MALSIKPKAGCRFDLVALGEVMLRLDPGETRVATARSFRVWEGGGEYNVARNLKRCFGLDTALVSALADNPVGRLIQDCIFQGGVDQTHLRFVPYDGVGRTVRNGLNFTERGFGQRGSVSCADRGHSAASQIKPGDFDWPQLFSSGVRWFHTGGIFAGLSESTAAVAAEAMQAARRHGVIVSYDLNYRESLWRGVGGRARADAVNQSLARHVDVMVGNADDLAELLGLRAHADNLAELFAGAARAFPGWSVIATTLRRSPSANHNDWSAACWQAGTLYRATPRTDLEVFDRVGGGDAFASGFIYGLLAGRDLQWAVECGAAHGALVMTTPGDSSMATLAEVEQAMRGADARAER